MPFMPNLDCAVTRQVKGSYDRFGQPKLEERRWKLRCALVKLDAARAKTAVRTDSSASRGFAREAEIDARILFPATFAIQKGDFVDVLGHKLRVESVFPRVNIGGYLDHYQVDAMIEVED